MYSKFYLSSLLLLVTLILFSCKEDEVTVNTNSVTISGEEYQTAAIGAQVWTIVNYDGPGGVAFNAQNSKPEYGKYYTQAEANAVVVPEGWRLPTMNDYIKMAEASGVTVTDYRSYSENVKVLASIKNWRTIPGNNASGFNAHPAGYMYGTGAAIDGDIAEFWTSEGNTFSLQEGADQVRMRLLFYTSSNDPLYRFNVRFVKDNVK